MGSMRSDPSRPPPERDDAVSDQTSSVDLHDLIRQLESVDAPGLHDDTTRRPVRLIVAADWTDAAVPLTLLRAFRAIVTPGLPLQLAFAVPHAPTEDDAACVQTLAEGVFAGAVSSPLEGLEVLSFDEAADQPYDSAVVPAGDVGELIVQVGGLIMRMHDLVRRHEAESWSECMNQGSGPALRARLDAFTA